MPAAPLKYPIELDQPAICRLIPHRPPMLFIRQARVLAHNVFEGQASWQADHPLLVESAPQRRTVPAALVLEATAQLAGAGLLAGDPVARSIGPGHLGMLQLVRTCTFSTLALADACVHLRLHCRRMAEKAVVVTGTAHVEQHAIATLEFMLAHVPAQALEGVLAQRQLQHLMGAPNAGA